MANDPALDAVDYGGVQGVTNREFESQVYEDIEEDDLFWLTNSQNSNVNHAHRKIDNSSALNTRTRELKTGLRANITVYQQI